MSESSNGTTGKPDLVALRAEIKQTRAELGETVQALAARADVKARAREQVAQTRQRLLGQAAAAGDRLQAVSAGTVRANQLPVVLIAAGLAAVVGVILIVRGRR
ncbi:hypothetical protein ACWT_6433 [Actinoplanes sp. SE50]|uniref:DUF3618 domain-containing protein n=1 Tax=unclassified Actinoplanes TaxID=2626549 RepID=UPI00023EBE0F|nr:MULTISPECIES: DUF3618 domain-containing protein [unclassified Actinoplanes]AEV87446.1 hypothetical protein ACPL_6564 [Actinoplanes sp. SE50/110]ATO85848.1 hypothetical protein ACWT_6433 [Actinoplanes sp. SE50]SLM03262.1 uncharacterized protein ACSP50_6551 [Actinoplanes sp. SE50/110]